MHPARPNAAVAAPDGNMKPPRRNLARPQREAMKPPARLIVALAIILILSAAGCGAPGEPVPPSPPIPTPITDLTAQQRGDAVLLNFTVPGKSVAGDKLKDVPTIEVLRGSLGTDGSADAKSFRVVETVPGAMIGSYTVKGKVNFLSPIAADEVRRLSGQTVLYCVRARVSDRKTSANSNNVNLKLYAVAGPIDTLSAHLTEPGIDLSWTAPEHTSSGESIAAIAEYHVYRGELDPASTEAATKDLSRAVWKAPLTDIATTKTTDYRDNGFEYGKTLAYVIRSVLGGASGAVESGDSLPAILTPKDTFPPAAPQGIVAAVLPGATAGKYVADLSWAISAETDLGGYHIYRSEQQGERGLLMNAEVLPTPAYRDESVETGKHYWYTVTAVDRAGNESLPSEQTSVEITPTAP